ncbi:ornithine carbamoyltransferase, mitochondrial-like isoform X1 [Agrilus planipennis]|uniref:ornithine carbamoyltransferase n=1 Tax=Agrilus planipennis TaxID=224129 RepID=A0A1W4WZN5_AGRPL|nr:ornithine carbamoyltransferase, mitochondrial-like isoform X1 [Agrilus planipennis]
MGTFKLITVIKRHISSLKKKTLTCPLHLTDNDVIDMLWKALEFKKLYLCYDYQTKILRKCTLIYLSADSKMNFTIPILKATKLFGMDLKIISDSNWFKDNDLQDVASYLSNFGNIIAYTAKYHTKLQEMIDAFRIPVLCLQDCRYSVADTLSDIMTFYEQFGYLTDLKLAWLGPPSSELNTFLHLAPHFGIQVAYCCSCDPETRTSPSSLFEAKNEFNATKYIEKSREKLNTDLFKNAKPNWVYLRKLPRAVKEADDHVFKNFERCITWKSSINNVWIYMSLIMKLLKEYKNVTHKPNFENTNSQQRYKVLPKK